MIQILILWLIAPVTIYLCLVVLGNAALTLVLFQGIICFLIPLVDFKLIQHKNIRQYFLDMGFQNFRKTFFPAFVTGLVFCFLIYGFFVWLETYVLDMTQMQSVLDSWHIDKKYLLPLMIAMVLSNSIFEEIYWRGYVYHKLESKVSSFNVIILTAFFYMSYHLITTINLFSVVYGVLFSSVIFCVGLFWGLMKKKYNSLYFSILSHLLADLGIMLIYFKYFGR